MILKAVCKHCRRMNTYKFAMNVKGKIKVKALCKGCKRKITYQLNTKEEKKDEPIEATSEYEREMGVKP